MENLGVPEEAITRTEYYAAAGTPEPNGNGPAPSPPESLDSQPAPARRCLRCGVSLEGRPNATKWCSDACRKRGARTSTHQSPLGPAPVRHDEAAAPVATPNLEHATGDDVDARLDKLVSAVAHTVASDKLTAVTFELDGLAVTVGRVD